jgi:restriction system protein
MTELEQQEDTPQSDIMSDSIDLPEQIQDNTSPDDLPCTEAQDFYEPGDIHPESHQEYEVYEHMLPQQLEFSQLNDTQPLELEDVLAKHNSQLAEKVLARTANLSSDTFEVFVIDLLSKMGYRAFHNARYTSDDNDNGMIHGVILDPKAAAPLYIHAEKLAPDKTVGRSDVQDFVDALADKGGQGIFATTALFSESAVSYAQDERILLIDGPKLASLMISHNFCVNVEKVFEVKELDEDSFNDYES